MNKKSNRTFLPLSKKGLAALLGFTISALPVSNAFAVTPPTTQNSNIIVSDDFAWAKSAMTETGSTISIDFSEHFPRLDAHSLSLTAASTQQGVLTSEVSGKSVSLKITGYGTANIEVTATDQTNLKITDTFQITIDRMGDIDGDGVVTSSDALFISKVVKGLVTVSPEEMKKYDINKDGSVTNADVTALMTIIANQKNGATPPITENNYIVSIRNVNDAPIGLPKHFAVDEDTELKPPASLTADGIDIDQNTLSVSSVTQPAHGTLTMKEDGTFTYLPESNFNGTDTFTFKLNDGKTQSAPITVTIDVVPVNDNPFANDQSLTATEDTPLNGMLTGGDIDSTDLTYQLVTNGTKGTVTITNPATGAFTYTPNSNANGTDSFTFKISDGIGESNIATVTVEIAAVNDSPTAVADQYTTNEDETLTVSRTSGVISNDTDVDGDSLTAILVSGTSHGSLILNSDGSFQYKPDDNFYGTDQFTYKVNDGTSDSNVVTVTLNVTPVNDVPWAQGGTIQVTEDTPLNGILTGGDIDSTYLTYQLVTNGTKGTVTITNPATGAFTYTPNSNANGTDSFTFKISDGIGESTTATVTVVIAAVNDAPTVVQAISNQSLVTGTADKKLNISNVFADVDGDELVFSAVSNNANVASVSISGTELTLTPVAAGTATITITANDGHGGIETSTFDVNVTNPNVAPVVANSISNISTTVGNAVSTIDLSATFSDADHDVLTYSATSSAPSVATTTVSGKSLSITPLAAGTTTITVTAADGNGGTVSTTFTVTVEAAKSVTLTASLFDRDQLTEANLKAATILLTLDGDTFKDTATEADFKLNNAPPGLTIGPALVMGNEAYLILDYEGQDFDVDYSNFSITALGSATESGNPIQSSPLTIKAIQEPNGPLFFSEYVQSDGGRVALEIYNKGITPENGYTLEVYQYNTLQNKKTMTPIAIPIADKIYPNMTYNIIDSSFYDFFDITNAWYYNDEMILSGNGLVNTAFLLKKNGVVVDAIGDPNSTAPILQKNGTIVRKQSFAGGMATYQEYQWSLYPNGTFQFFGTHTP